MNMTMTIQKNINVLENAHFIEGKPTKNKVASLSGVTFMKIAIKAGDELPSHHLENTSFAILMQGRAICPITGVHHYLSAGSIVEIPHHYEHSITAQEDSIFLLGCVDSK